MNNIHTYFFALILLTNLFSCDKKEEEFVDPSDPDALSAVLILPDGNVRQDGAPPPPTAAASAPSVTNRIPELISSNGSTTPLAFNYANAADDLAGCYVQIDGAGNYFIVPYNQASGSSGQLSLPLGLPTNVLEGTFRVNFSVFNNAGEVSNTATASVVVLRLGTGVVQISLSWDDTSDQDLHVTEPDGTTISYLNDYSDSGGQLDRDDLDGFGPENIFWDNDAPDGEYRVQVDHYSGPGPTTFYVTVSGGGVSRSFSGRTFQDERVDVVTFTKRGGSISF
ncbi:YfaP family protein [Lewinella sp. JB7]|uniref:YfaP family protein n=1 Tax=Lewinella sp. JB7 TaxID=2962887 RepID=UPI0020C9723B|nr:hypothetical protein [Lewinella sp. JB7]MCP9235988.1 hypothetical protein [Lewinella sp. JB7]